MGVGVNNLHEFGPQITTCVADPILDEDGSPILDESGNALCPEAKIGTIPFEFTINGSSFAIGLETVAGGGGPLLVYDFVVDWGDGNTDVITSWNDPALSHTYASSQTWTIQIEGVCPNLSLGASGPETGDRSKVTSITQWGSVVFTYLNNAFNDCYNMTLTATDLPDFSSVTDIRWMFNECRSIVTGAEGWDFSVMQTTSIRYLFDHCDKVNFDASGWNLTGITDMQGVFNFFQKFNNDISGWDTSLVTDMSYLFFFNNDFNHASISSLDTSAVTQMRRMLGFCQKLTQSVDGWSVGNVVSMQQLFESCDLYNQSVNSWDVAKVENFSEMFSDCFVFNQNFTSWVTTAATDMSYMFAATFGTGFGAFNGDISGFDTSKVTNMDRMLIHCNEFNHDISAWDVSLVAGMDFFMTNGTSFSTSNYDLLLNAWSLLSVQSGNLPVFAATYTIATSQVARDRLTDPPNNWTITDGGGI